MSSSSKAAIAVLKIMRNGKPRHTAEISEALAREGIKVPPVSVPALMMRVPGIRRDGTVKAYTSTGGKTNLVVWRLEPVPAK